MVRSKLWLSAVNRSNCVVSSLILNMVLSKLWLSAVNCSNCVVSLFILNMVQSKLWLSVVNCSNFVVSSSFSTWYGQICGHNYFPWRWVSINLLILMLWSLIHLDPTHFTVQRYSFNRL